jgi:hypothetical protein
MLDAATPFMSHLTDSVLLNKRDAPLARKESGESPFVSLGCKTLHPIYSRTMRNPLSFYSGEIWSDMPIPLPEAWKWSQACDYDGGGYLLQKCFNDNGRLDKSDFDLKRDKAVFRGTATGAGLQYDNQRIKLASLKIECLDIGITAWNQRDRIIEGVVDFQVPPKGICLKERLSPRDQSRYKIIINVDGHQASSRLIWHLASGCALVLVDSGPFCLAPKMWIHKFLQENIHYVRVKHDLSDIEDVLNSLDTNKLFDLAKNSYSLASKVLRPSALAQETAEAIISCAKNHA